MKRRNFIRKTGLAAAATPFMLNSIQMQAFATPMMAQSLDCTGLRERVLVIVQMFGGNDGLNTLVPIDQYSTYSQLRPNIAIPETGNNSYLNLDPSLPVADQIGLNPNMPEFREMYDNGLMSVVQGVGYENHNRSHFKSTDLIMTGGDGSFENFSLDTGWMGRYLDHSFPGLAGYSSPVMPDPLGIQLGNTESSLGFHIKGEFGSSINLSGQDLAGYYTLVSAIGGAPINNIPNSEYGKELAYALNVETSASNYSSRISSVFNKGRNALSYPGFDLANQLKTVARLIDGGCQSKIYMVYMGGFDTHGNQLARHTNLLTELSQSIKAFQEDLKALRIHDRVLTATMSEFGRKAFENGNEGTDHGTLNHMMVFGSALKGGVYGTNLDLSVLDDGAPLNLQHDYRQVLTTLLQDWLGADKPALKATKFEDFENQKLDLIRNNQVADISIDCPVIDRNIGESGRLIQVEQKKPRQWHRVNLKRFYANPVVVMGPASSDGDDPLTIRVRNVSSHSFEWQVDEWDYLDGIHEPLDISYLVVEAGAYKLNNGKILMAGTSDNSLNHNWLKMDFDQPFTKAPAVFTQCTSGNGNDAVVTRIQKVNKSGFEVRLQEEEANDQSHTVENLAWVAIERGALVIGENGFTGQASYSASKVNEKDYTLKFGTTYTEKPVFLAQAQTFSGSNPISIRYKNLRKNQVSIYLQEEQSKDKETKHPGKERIAYLALEKEGIIAGQELEDASNRVSRTSAQAFHINCYPNPFVDQFIIESIEASGSPLSVMIIDMQGKILVNEHGHLPDASIKIQASHFPSGMYVVRVSDEQNIATFNVVKR